MIKIAERNKIQLLFDNKVILHFSISNDDLFKLYCMILLIFGRFSVTFSRIFTNLEEYSTEILTILINFKSTFFHKIKILKTQCRF